MKPIDLQEDAMNLEKYRASCGDGENGPGLDHLEETVRLTRRTAHDFNNLLTILMGNIDLAKLCINPGDHLERYLQAMETVAEKARLLNQRLLTFAWNEGPLWEKLGLADFLPIQIAMAFGGSTNQVNLTLSPNLWVVIADPRRLGQVLQSLLHHAREASAGSGPLTVSAANVRLGGDNDQALPEGHYVLIAISDAGEGEGSGAPGSLFPGVKQKPIIAFGLTLPLCRSLMQQMGGSVAVAPVTGGNALAHLHVPAQPDAQERH